METLKEDGIFFVGTVRTGRMKNCPLMYEKDLKNGRGSVDYRLERESNIVAVRWFDNRRVNLLSSYIGVEPMEEAKRYDRSQRKHIQVPMPQIVKVLTNLWEESTRWI